jgi:hypothetical protein
MKNLIILPPIIEMGRTASEMAHPPIAVFLVVYVQVLAGAIALSFFKVVI